MSFSSEVKEELAKKISPARHCQMAELAAIMSFCGQYGRQEGSGLYVVGFQTENEAVVRKGFTLLKKTFKIEMNEMNLPEDFIRKMGNLEEPVSPLLIKNSCCRRAFLRGAFLSIGSMSDPAKGYHLEFYCCGEPKALQLQEVLRDFVIESRIILRKKYHVVYLKEGSGIVDLLNVCEAPVALMKLENLRIFKEVRNSVNRRVNCETANIAKTVNAASRQVEDIEYLRDFYGFENLPEALREMAQVRLENPEAPLKELGECFSPALGKSGVNHRLRRLSELADQVRVYEDARRKRNGKEEYPFSGG